MVLRRPRHRDRSGASPRICRRARGRSGRDLARLPAQAKLLASRVAVTAASQAIQICGAQGMLESLPFGRYLRDAKAYEIAGGSSEILKNTIAEHLD